MSPVRIERTVYSERIDLAMSCPFYKNVPVEERFVEMRMKRDYLKRFGIIEAVKEKQCYGGCVLGEQREVYPVALNGSAKGMRISW